MDIDIDFPDRDQLLSLIEHRVARLENGKKHNTGIYVTEIPSNPINNLASIDYKTADNRGYFKIDFLNVSIYKGVRDRKHLDTLINTEPYWELLQHQEFSDNVFHLSGHSSTLQKLKPDSLTKLAATLAIIRPAKRHLIDYSWEEIFQEVWTKPLTNDYYFKKSHSFSYAMAVIVHMNLLCEEISS